MTAVIYPKYTNKSCLKNTVPIKGISPRRGIFFMAKKPFIESGTTIPFKSLPTKLDIPVPSMVKESPVTT